jgi:hypothetical protein
MKNVKKSEQQQTGINKFMKELTIFGTKLIKLSAGTKS